MEVLNVRGYEILDVWKEWNQEIYILALSNGKLFLPCSWMEIYHLRAENQSYFWHIFVVNGYAESKLSGTNKEKLKFLYIERTEPVLTPWAAAAAELWTLLYLFKKEVKLCCVNVL